MIIFYATDILFEFYIIMEFPGCFEGKFEPIATLKKDQHEVQCECFLLFWQYFRLIHIFQYGLCRSSINLV